MTKKNIRKLIDIAIIIIVLLLILALRACAEEIEYPANLWKGIIGEAVSEGYDGMYAVACVYRNRIKADMPLGCVALKRKDLDRFIKRQGSKYERMAKDIVEKVFHQDGKDVTQGSTHYENIERFPVPYWAKDMQVVCKIGKHTFYKKKDKKIQSITGVRG